MPVAQIIDTVQLDSKLCIQMKHYYRYYYKMLKMFHYIKI